MLFSLKDYRVVDLSAEVHPGVFKINGDYTWGKESRKFEVREFIAAHDRMLMHWVDTQWTQCGGFALTAIGAEDDFDPHLPVLDYYSLHQ